MNAIEKFIPTGPYAVGIDWLMEQGMGDSLFIKWLLKKYTPNREFALRHVLNLSNPVLAEETEVNMIPGIQWIHAILGKELWDFIKSREDIWLAGGSLTRSIFTRNPIKMDDKPDIDLFCMSQEAFDQLTQMVEAMPPANEHELSTQWMVGGPPEDRYDWLVTDENGERGPASQSELFNQNIRRKYARNVVTDGAEYNEARITQLRDFVYAIFRDQPAQEDKSIKAQKKRRANELSMQPLYAEMTRLSRQREWDYQQLDIINRPMSTIYGPATNTVEATLDCFDLNMSKIATNLTRVVVSPDWAKGIRDHKLEVTNPTSHRQDRWNKYLMWLPKGMGNHKIVEHDDFPF